MNNYHFIAITKAIKPFQKGDFDSVELALNEFVDMHLPASDTQLSAIEAARGNSNIPSDLVDIFEEVAA